MFNVNTDNYTVRMSKGDTGSISYELAGDTLTSSDRVVWTMSDTRGNVVKQEILTPSDNVVEIEFGIEDTQDLDAGTYRYDLRVLIGPDDLTIDSENKKYTLSDVDDVYTPLEAVTFVIVDTVGHVEKTAAE